MKENRTLDDYSLPVHKSLFHVDMLFGIGSTAAMILVVVTIICMQIVGFWFLIVSLGILFVLRLLCKNDPFLVDIILDNLLEQDLYEG